MGQFSLVRRATIIDRGNRWFFIANYLPPLINLHKTTAFQKNKVLDVHERTEAMVLTGFSFLVMKKGASPTNSGESLRKYNDRYIFIVETVVPQRWKSFYDDTT